MIAKLILFLPLLGAIFVGLQTRSMNVRIAQVITTTLLFVAAILSAVTFKDVAIDGNAYTVKLFDWIHSGDFKANWAIKVDTLTAIMFCVVTFVSSLVHLYSIGYMDEDPHKQRFMAYLSLFTFFMLVLITADNFIQMFVGWEGVGLCSYLLIGFWFKKPSANAASIKAFLVNRVGDFGFILGIAAVFMLFGTVQFDEVFAAAQDKFEVYWDLFGFEVHAITLASILLFIGAMGKSAQFGLHTWLPDAMEGPTPVSALIHAATMVTAGVFMLARISPMIEYSPTALGIITVVGGVTAIFAATVALTQNDIKKVIAYSTCSQLGYMIFACGLSVYAAGVFHLATHAFFKALLFLGAGSVIHAMHHEQDMRNYGGLWKKIPFTWVMMAIGSVAIIGAPYFAGYYSKEAIIAVAANRHDNLGQFAYWMGAITALLTAFYSARLFFLTFHGKPRDQKAYDHAHESPLVMTIPLFLLSIGAIFSGYYGEQILEILAVDGEFWNGAVASIAGDNPLKYVHQNPDTGIGGPPHWIVPAVAVFSIIGLVIYSFKLPHWAAPAMILLAAMGYWMHLAEPGVIAVFIVSTLVVGGLFAYYQDKKFGAKTYKALYNFSLNKWYIDELYEAVFIKPYIKLSKNLWKFWDTKIVDGMPNGAAKLSTELSSNLSKFQTGYIFQYAFVIVASVFAIITYYILD